MPPASAWPDPVRPVSGGGGNQLRYPLRCPGAAERGCPGFWLLGWLPKS